MKHRITILAALFVLATGSASAQSFGYNETNNLFYFAQRTPQSNMLNPAFFPSTFYLQLPGLNGLQFGLPLSIGDVVKYDAEQQANIVNINNIFDCLTENNKFRVGFDVNVLGLGLKIAGVFVDANMQLKGNFNLGLPMDAVNFVVNGNVQPDGTPYPEMPILDGDFFNMQMYVETSIGAGMKIPATGLTVGVHAKLLSGLINMQTDNTKVTFETDPDYESVRARMYYEVRGASIIPIEEGQTMNEMVQNLSSNVKDIALSLIDFNGGNNGVAFDLGAKYRLGPVTLSASINDLSAGIHWQKNVIQMTPKGGQVPIEFSGIDIANLLDRGSINTDTLQQYLNDQVDMMVPQFLSDTGDYWYPIPTKLNLAATVNLGILKAGILMHGQWDRGLLSKNTYSSVGELYDDATAGHERLKNTFRFNTTLSVGVNLFNWVELVAGSSFIYDGSSAITINNFLNPGLGLIVTPATLVQAYVMMDYASSLYFTQMKAFNFKMGFNLLIGK